MRVKADENYTELILIVASLAEFMTPLSHQRNKELNTAVQQLIEVTIRNETNRKLSQSVVDLTGYKANYLGKLSLNADEIESLPNHDKDQEMGHPDKSRE